MQIQSQHPGAHLAHALIMGTVGTWVVGLRFGGVFGLASNRLLIPIAYLAIVTLDQLLFLAIAVLRGEPGGALITSIQRCSELEAIHNAAALLSILVQMGNKRGSTAPGRTSPMH